MNRMKKVLENINMAYKNILRKVTTSTITCSRRWMKIRVASKYLRSVIPLYHDTKFSNAKS